MTCIKYFSNIFVFYDKSSMMFYYDKPANTIIEIVITKQS